MIPRHRPPFQTRSLCGSLWRSLFASVGPDAIEDCYRRQLDVRHAVWIPSARYGITRTVQKFTADDADVICPAFNCGAVHHAARETGRTVRFADSAPDSFLVDCSVRAGRGHAIILSEMFGHRFSEVELNQPAVRDAAVRIFDLAMGIPTAADMHRMQGADVTVLSFGLGKSLYAGWGGLALTHSNEAAAELRAQRDRDLAGSHIIDRLRWTASVFARTLAHERGVYRYVRTRQLRRTSNQQTNFQSFSPETHEWHRPATSFHVQRCLENMDHSAHWAARRVEIVTAYQQQLRQLVDVVKLPLAESREAALSHYSLRVPAACRDQIRADLWQRGVDAATLFPFPSALCDEVEFPQAARAAQEILNLPVLVSMSDNDVRMVCEAAGSAVEWALGEAHSPPFIADAA